MTGDDVKTYTIRLTGQEVAAIRDITKVDTVATAVRSLVLKAIERRRKWRGQCGGGAAE